MTSPVDELERTAAALRAECAELIESTGLLELLARFGEPRPTGSFRLDLMAWRDLDIELIAEGLSVERFFDLGRQLAALLQPARMSFRNERIMQTDGLPLGLYWGIHLPEPRDWKIDLWAVEKAELERRSTYIGWVEASLTPETRQAILEIKSAVWSDPAYRKDYTSKDLYDAVLAENVRDVDAFLKFVRGRALR